MTLMQLQGERVRTAGCLCYRSPGWGTSLMLGFLPASLGSPAVPQLGTPNPDALLLYRELSCGLCYQPWGRRMLRAMAGSCLVRGRNQPSGNTHTSWHRSRVS